MKLQIVIYYFSPLVAQCPRLSRLLKPRNQDLTAADSHLPERTLEACRAFSIKMPKQPETAIAAAQRLRDSCHACAASKVKCSKDKPTCVRCTRRGTTCQYFATKRPGRKRNSNSIEVPTTPTTPTSWHGDFADSLKLGIFDQKKQSYVDSDIDPQPSSTPQWFSTAPVPDSAITIDAVPGFEFGNWPLSPVS